uniref:SH2 domain-containing protein 3C n=1 Tax=Cacopsylla melanoneura TaxID=428564 RepID=A0A8D8R8I3_9HEMI
MVQSPLPLYLPSPTRDPVVWLSRTLAMDSPPLVPHLPLRLSHTTPLWRTISCHLIRMFSYRPVLTWTTSRPSSCPAWRINPWTPQHCGSDSERAEILNKWIQVAVDTKTALGNLFGFSNIMLGLMMPQIQRLSVTWHVLRQKFTDSAFSFEAKLRPTLKSMNECTNPNAPNTTIPYVLPLILLQEKSFDDLCAQNCLECLNLFSSCITCWETSSSDFGLTILFNHLESARKLTEGLHTFQRNCQIVLSDSKVDDLLLDMFRTEFHLKFLWGSKGSGAHLMQRYKKFEQILNVMSAKCQPDEDSNNKTSSSNGCEVSNKQSAISSNCDVGNMGHSQSHYTALGTNV